MNRNQCCFIKGMYIIVLLLIVSSCYDKDLVNNIGDTVYYTPEYALPIGNQSFTMDDVITGLDSALVEIPDTSNLPDDIPIFIYNGVVYENPLILEHTSIEPLDFSTVSENLEHVVALMLRTNCVNEVPGELQLRVSFLDGSQTPIMNLCEECFFTIEAAETNTDGTLIEPGILMKHDIYFSDEEIALMEFVEYIRVDAVLNVEELAGKQVLYYPEQKFAVQLGVKVNFNIPLHEI